MKNNCNNPFVSIPLDDPSILNVTTDCNNRCYAMVSVPWQTPGKMYSACEGLNQGTIFADLDQPYVCPICNPKKREGCDCE